MKKWKIKLENYLLKKISNVVVAEDIIKYNIKNDEFYFRGKKLNPTDLKNLREEVEFIKRSDIWKIITNSLREEARKTMNEKAMDFDDMRSGKLLLYAISLQEKIIQKLNK